MQQTNAPSVGLIASSADGTKLIAVASGGTIYISADWGETWTKTDAPNENWNSVACSSDGGKLVAVAGNTLAGEIYVSTNFGNSWTQSSAPSGYWRHVASSADGSIMVASVDPGLIYISNDSGATWTLTSAPTYNGVDSYVWEVSVSADGSTMFVAGGWNGPGFGFIYTSTNSGATWTQVNAPSKSWVSLSASPEGTKLAAIGDGLTYISTNSGTTWSQTSLPGVTLYAGVAMSGDGSKFVVWQWAGPIYTWVNSVPTWTFTSAPTNAAWISIASSADGSKLAAAQYYGLIYTSANSGATWEATSAPDEVWSSVASSADGAKLVAASGAYYTNGLIYISTNFGANWHVTSAPNTNWLCVASSADGSQLVAVVYGGSIYVSTNSGVDWTITTAPSKNWWSVATSADGTHLAAVTLASGPIYVSTNSGATWMATDSPNNIWWDIVSSADGSELVALGYGVYISTNSGSSWWRANAPIANWWSATLSADGSKLAAVAHGGLIYVSSDLGTSWTATSAPSENWEVIASSADGTKLTAGIYGGGIYTMQPTPAPPFVVTLPATGTNGDVVLNGVVNPNGMDTTAWFEWGTSPTCGNTTTPVAVSGGETNVLLNVALSGLIPGAAYYYRAAATNDLGLAYGTNILFRLPDTMPPTIFCSTNITVEFTSAVGAQVFFSAQATDLYSGRLTVNCAPPSGSTFPIGTNTVTCTATDDSGNIAQTNFLVTVLGARGVDKDVLAEMEALQAARIGRIPFLDMAIMSLTHSLTTQLWADEVHLKAKNGQNVFLEDADTVLALRILMEHKQSPIAKGILQGWINRLVKADRLLATMEIASATNAGVTPQRLSNASKEIIQGDKAMTKQQHASAIMHYQNAWNMALRLIGSGRKF